MDSDSGAKPRLILASASPRRRELMRALDIPIEVVSPGGDEEAPRCVGEDPARFVLRLSLEKARQVAALVGKGVVLGADTTVALDGQTYGKPATSAEAVRMLQILRGRAHTVVTGVTALDAESGRWVSAAKSTRVVMRHYSDEELAAYVASGEPFDKAGAYAVQDARFRPALEVDGCYLNVVGLPMCEVMGLLAALGAQARLTQGWRPPEQCRSCPLEERQAELQE